MTKQCKLHNWNKASYIFLDCLHFGLGLTGHWHLLVLVFDFLYFLFLVTRTRLIYHTNSFSVHVKLSYCII